MGYRDYRRIPAWLASSCNKWSAYLCSRVLYNLLVCHIRLVADQELVDTFGGVSVNFLEPLLDVVEGVHVGDIVDDTDTVSTTVVRRCDCAEAFLTSGIPLERVSKPCKLGNQVLTI
jgi:hypothetical protein